MSTRFAANKIDFGDADSERKWKNNWPQCLQDRYRLADTFWKDVNKVVTSRDEYDVEMRAVNLYTSEEHVEVQYVPKSEGTGDGALYQQMNAALREWRAGAGSGIIAGLCNLVWKGVVTLWEMKGTPCKVVYFGIDVELPTNNGWLFLKCFRSTSKKIEVARDFGPFLYEVGVYRSLVCAAVSEYSDYMREDEVLINPGQNIRIKLVE